MPLGSSSAAPVMRPGPNCFTRGSSAMLLIRLTMARHQKAAKFQKRIRSPEGEGVEIGGSRPARSAIFGPFAPSALGRTALRGNLRRHRVKARVLRAQHRSPHVQLLTRTACVTDDGRDDRPALQQCKEINDEKAKSHGRKSELARRASRGFTRSPIRRACLWNQRRPRVMPGPPQNPPLLWRAVSRLPRPWPSPPRR